LGLHMSAAVRLLPVLGNSNINATGTVRIVSDGGTGVWIYASVSGIPAGVHGIHIHEFGDLNSTDGLSVGGHFNPYGMNHSCYPSVQRHVGDIGNITVGSDGTGSATYWRDLITLVGANSIIGRAVVIHALFDNCVTPLTGGAGLRLLFGVVGVENNDTQTAYSPDPYVANFFTAIMIPTYLSGISSDVKGIVNFGPSATAGKVHVNARLFGSGLTAYSKRGFHIHMFGDLSSLDQANLAIGGHWNTPLGSSTHGLPAADGTGARHVGDMGNVYISWDQQVYFAQDFDLIELTGVNSIVGRTVAVHAIEDVGGTAALGNKIAVGVIGFANTAKTFPADQTAPTDPNPPVSSSSSTFTAGPSGSSSTAVGGGAMSNAQVSVAVFVTLLALLAFFL